MAAAARPIHLAGGQLKAAAAIVRVGWHD